MPFSFIDSALKKREAANLKRQRHTLCRDSDGLITFQGKRYLDFSSNDYLGMANHPDVVNAAHQAMQQHGIGSCGSAMVTGYHPCHQALEEYLADWLGYERCMLFNSGFSANTGVVETLMQHPDGLLVQDKLNHASLIDAGINCKSNSVRFNHNDMPALERRLQGFANNKLVVTEGVFSMDGDTADLPSAVKLAKAAKAGFMIDDAHGIGVIGEQGKGTAAHLGIESNQIDVHMATFGKAVGTAGAFVAASNNTIEYLLQFNRHYIYSTAMPPAIAAGTLQSLKIIAKDQWRRDKLAELVGLFKQRARKLGLPDNHSSSAIQPIIIKDAAKAVMISEALKEAGIWLTAIRPPTVPVGTSRLRVTLTCHHQSSDIDRLFDQLELLL